MNLYMLDAINILQQLVDKIEEIEKDKSYEEIFLAAYLSGIDYTGPTWEEELKKAKELLEKVGEA